MLIVQCSEPHAPEYGSVILEGSIATYSCDVGYELIGETTVTCSNGTWSASPPTCMFKES